MRDLHITHGRTGAALAELCLVPCGPRARSAPGAQAGAAGPGQGSAARSCPALFNSAPQIALGCDKLAAKQLNGDDIWSAVPGRAGGVAGKCVMCRLFPAAPVQAPPRGFQNLLRELLLQLNVGVSSMPGKGCPKARADVGADCVSCRGQPR